MHKEFIIRSLLLAVVFALVAAGNAGAVVVLDQENNYICGREFN